MERCRRVGWNWKEIRKDGEFAFRFARATSKEDLETDLFFRFPPRFSRWYYSYSANSSAASLNSQDPNRLSMASSSSSHHPLLAQNSQRGSNPSSSSSPTPTASRSSSMSSLPNSSHHQARPHPPYHHNSAPSTSSSTSAAISAANGKQRAALSSMFGEIPPELLRFMEEEDEFEGGGAGEAPKFAPSCDACGIRLEYMRYSCLKVSLDPPSYLIPLESSLVVRSFTQCGDGDLHEQAPPLITFPDDSSSSPHSHSNGHASASSSYSHPNSGCCEEVHHHHHSSSPNSNSNSHDEDDDGYASDGTELLGHRKSISSSLASANKPLPPTPASRRGFELCAGCIEEHGREHARAFFRSRVGGGNLAVGRVKGEVGHTFRERVWSGSNVRGWKDVGELIRVLDWVEEGKADELGLVETEYDEVSACSTCNNHTFTNRYKCKCVSHLTKSSSPPN